MKNNFSFLYNKYFLALISLMVWVCFFDENDFFYTQNFRLKELQALQQKEHYYNNEIMEAKQQLSDIKNNTESVEKFAREKYFMKKNGEDLYIIEN